MPKSTKAATNSMLRPRLMRAARALAGWEQSDLAKASGISISTVRKIEQGAIGTLPRTEARIIAAFERAGLQLIPEGPDGGAGARWKEREMSEQMREPALPEVQMRTLMFMLQWSREYVESQSTWLPSERAATLGDIQMFADWIDNNWPA